MDKTFPPLFAKASTGKTKVWQIRVESAADGAKIITSHGYADQEELQIAEVKVTEGKNIGKANETTPFEQACSQAESKWNKKRDKKYVEDSSGESDIVLPMLAHTFTKRKHDIEWPALTQPKLNGVRCLAKKISEKKISYSSREGKSFSTLEHLTPDLLKIMEVGQILDGEIFTREMTFQQIISAVKRLQPDSEKLQLWVYDIVEPETPFSVRRMIYHKMVESANSDKLVSVLCQEAQDEKEVMQLHDHHAFNGFEGIMIRNTTGVYKDTHRSKDLQKHKDFIDEEFEIIGYHDGDGKDEGAVTWICVTKDGEEFDCTPNGTYDERRQWWKDRKKYIGKMITVRYQNLSDDRNVPIFPKGLGIRDYE